MAGAGFPYRWNEDYEAQVGVRPVEGGGIKWMSVDPCYVFHVLNGHDVGDSMLSLELSVHPSVYARDVHGPNDGPPTLHRWTVDVDAGVIKDEQLDDRQSEFPRVDPVATRQPIGSVTSWRSRTETARRPSRPRAS